MSDDKKPPDLLDWLGLRRQIDFRKARPLGYTLGFVAVAVVLFLVAMLAATMWDFMRAALGMGPYEGDPTGEAIRNIGLVLAAFFGAPFLVWRTWVAARQTALQDEALFNDKINAAATDLAARRQVTRVLHKGTEKECIALEWEDDLVTRAAAIDRLEGLAQEAMDRGDFAPAQRIARMLSIYVQELSREFPAVESPKDIWDRETNGSEHAPPKSPEEMRKEFGLEERDTEPGALREWAQTLTPIRPDMERAVQSLGRINPVNLSARTAFDPSLIDLHSCNLQGFNLSGMNFQGTQMAAASMQGADFVRTEFQRANLIEARLQGANLSWANLQRAHLRSGEASEGAKLQGAVLVGAQLRGAEFLDAQLQGANLSWANLQRADLREAKISMGTNLTKANLRGAAVTLEDERPLMFYKPHWADIFYAARSLPEGHPPHWIAEDLFDEDFIDAWLAWAATLDPPVTIAPGYNP
ncbi:pentapeptide repeat-containing protein [Gymnodinialimonas sp.]